MVVVFRAGRYGRSSGYLYSGCSAVVPRDLVVAIDTGHVAKHETSTKYMPFHR